jgi:hypothetical protein
MRGRRGDQASLTLAVQARIFTAAPGLVNLIRGASWAETGLPECFQVTEGRLDELASKCW